MYRGENEWAKACSIAPQNASLAQLAEHVTVNHGVVGSSPSRGAKTRRPPIGVVFLFRLPTGSNHSCFAEQNMKVFAVGTLQIEPNAAANYGSVAHQGAPKGKRSP